MNWAVQLHPKEILPALNNVLCGHGIFEEDWWLDAVAPNSWDAVEIRSDNLVQARMPFAISKKHGLRCIQQPILTQTLGPWFRPTDGKVCSQLAREKDLATELISKLPKHDFFSMNFHHSVQNWLPFFWQGFSASPRITYVIDELSDLQVLWDNLQSNIRREIRKAEKLVEVVDSDDIEQFLALNQQTFERQGIPYPNHRATALRINEACAKRNSRKIYLARDEQGRFHAGVFIVYDDRCAYYLMGGGDPLLRSSGATSLLMWKAIQNASQTSKLFDFEGSMGESIERFFRAFGSRQAPYLNVRRHSKVSGVLEGLRLAYRSIRTGR